MLLNHERTITSAATIKTTLGYHTDASQLLATYSQVGDVLTTGIFLSIALATTSRRDHSNVSRTDKQYARLQTGQTIKGIDIATQSTNADCLTKTAFHSQASAKTLHSDPIS